MKNPQLLKITLFIALLIVAGAGESQARLGETSAQIKTRYGESFNGFGAPNGVTTCSFRLRNFIITVDFVKDKSISEKYHHVSGRQLTDSEIEALLNANADGGKVQVKDKAAKEWNIVSDAKVVATASYSTKEATLTVSQDEVNDMSGF